ncbi:MAG: hypothetical protein COV10_01200 [Candidatus Vogelbacteria bacterium CG10_big_fil_rev_8_21_14_0_10_51_16]|uniref:Prepilin-type N-terminal cleavage/methylation domain-containing protein n=1 Tax=Candidatus Vogelbacteria bacterium CG10_big_fil_rev_8_21_14_0_10_51_16 TaxID=1975045 RepID=A0A2H0RGI1_9BACT|nr:MAG: hypothetical protein COV10_01200 [Candidatus Vogelbacteria bacterium CG10_big_fil_rev_8_21_14_0_10_51_16]
MKNFKDTQPGLLRSLRASSQRRNHRGLTLVEVLVALGIAVLIILALANFQSDMFRLYGVTTDSLSVQRDVRTFQKTILAELRAVQESDMGGHPVAIAKSDELAFFSDVDADGRRERIRYFTDDRTLWRGESHSFGSPPEYDFNDEEQRVMVSYVVATTTPLFSYYPAGHVPTLAPLAEPIDVQAVRLIQISVSADIDPLEAPGVITGVSQVSLRNLKDNL